MSDNKQIRETIVKKIISIIVGFSTAFTPMYGYSAIPRDHQIYEQLENDGSHQEQMVVGIIKARKDGSACAVDIVDLAQSPNLAPSFMKVPDPEDLEGLQTNNNHNNIEEINGTLSQFPPCGPNDMVGIQGVAEMAFEGPVEVAFLFVAAFVGGIVSGCVVGTVGVVGIATAAAIKAEKREDVVVQIAGVTVGMLGTGVGTGVGAIVGSIAGAVAGAVIGGGAGVGILTCGLGEIYYLFINNPAYSD